MFMRASMLFLAVLVLAPTAAVGQTKPEQEIVWPPAPETPRIRYEGSVRSAYDVGKKVGFFSRMRDGILGDDNVVDGVQRPWDVHVDAEGVIYVSNASSQGLFVIDPNEKESHWLRGEGPATVSKAMGLDGTSDGLIFIADPGGRRVVAMDPLGQLVASYGGPDVLLNPVDVALSPDETTVYVADSYLHQVLAFDRAGTLIGRIGNDIGTLAEKAARRSEALTHTMQVQADSLEEAPEAPTEPSDLFENRGSGEGEFRYPAFIETAPDGTIYVADVLNFRVQAFHADGTFSHEFGENGDIPGRFTRIKGIGVDSHGQVYVADAAFSNLQVFDPQGALLMAFARLGSGPGEVWMPGGVTVDGSDRVLVADRYNNRIQVFQYLHVEEDTVDGGTGPNSASESN